VEGLETLHGVIERSLDEVAEKFCAWRWRARDSAWLIGEAKDFASVGSAEKLASVVGLHLRREMSGLVALAERFSNAVALARRDVG
jgi:hypothetical protein